MDKYKNLISQKIYKCKISFKINKPFIIFFNRAFCLLKKEDLIKIGFEELTNQYRYNSFAKDEPYFEHEIDIVIFKKSRKVMEVIKLNFLDYDGNVHNEKSFLLENSIDFIKRRYYD